jgi:hypothetical protein
LRNGLRLGFRSRALIGSLAVAAAAMIPATASAQNLFDFLFGGGRRGPPPSARSFADPSSDHRPSPRRADPERRSVASGGGSGTFCVRLCDGRYFPVPRSGANPAQLCNSFCPASETKVFSAGGGIDHAVASDGTRYASLRNAFAFRQRVAENCTCNGRDPYGLVRLDVASDPTLRAGDIVATKDGFVAYTGGNRRDAAFTPISGELRDRLSQTRITPGNATPVSADAIRDLRAAVHDDRHVQLDR